MGSEMCIRDRRGRHPRFAAQLADRTIGPLPGGQGGGPDCGVHRTRVRPGAAVGGGRATAVDGRGPRASGSGRAGVSTRRSGHSTLCLQACTGPGSGLREPAARAAPSHPCAHPRRAGSASGHSRRGSGAPRGARPAGRQGDRVLERCRQRGAGPVRLRGGRRLPAPRDRPGATPARGCRARAAGIATATAPGLRVPSERGRRRQRRQKRVRARLRAAAGRR